MQWFFSIILQLIHNSLFVYSSMSFASMSVNEDESAYGGSQSGISSQRSSMQGSIHILRKHFYGTLWEQIYKVGVISFQLVRI